jgi:L-methionine (R)-S-oxide reductase
MTFASYLNSIGLSYLESHSDENLNRYVEAWFDCPTPRLTENEVRKLYQYHVPKLGPGGSCSITDELEEAPYDLSQIFRLNDESSEKQAMTLRLWRLKGIIDELQKETGADWLGVYRAVEKSNSERVLVKEAYKGAPSRAEFPLIEEFAKNSNNSTVGLTGKAVCFQNIAEYQGPYYKCDSKVQSEFCVPILDYTGAVTGIIDAESFHKQHFIDGRLLQIAKVCFDLGKIDPFF